MNQAEATRIKDKAFAHLIKALEVVVEHPELSNYTGELGAFLRRRHRNKRAEIDAALHPGKTSKKKEDRMTAKEVEAKTFKYPSSDPAGIPPAQTTPKAELERQKKESPVVADGPEPLKDEPTTDPEPDKKEPHDGAELYADITEDMTPDEIAEAFGGLPALKDWLKKQGVKIARNATAKTAAKTLAEFLAEQDND